MSRQIELIKNRCGEASLNVEDLTGPSLTEQMFQFKAFKFNKIRNDKQILICEGRLKKLFPFTNKNR